IDTLNIVRRNICNTTYNKSINDKKWRIILCYRTSSSDTNTNFSSRLTICRSNVHPRQSPREYLSGTSNRNFSNLRTAHCGNRSSHIRLFYFTVTVIDKYNFIQLINIFLEYDVYCGLISNNNLFGSIPNVGEHKNGFWPRYMNRKYSIK